MASTTYSIGGVAFGALSSSSGRQAVAIRVNSRRYDVKRFHPPGVDGNYIVRNGRMGGEIRAIARYVGPLATALAQFESDRLAWENANVAVIDDAGTTHSNCNVTTGGVKRLTDPKGFDDGSKVFFDAEILLTIDD